MEEEQGMLTSAPSSLVQCHTGLCLTSAMLKPLLKSPESRCVSPLWGLQIQPSLSHLGYQVLCPGGQHSPGFSPAISSPVTCSGFPAAATMPLSQSRAGQSPCSSKACRNLFGPVDHEQLQRDFEEKIRQQLEEAQQRWNFNFETETPLEGPFQWERIRVAEQPPQEGHSLVRAVISSDSRSSLAHRVPATDHLGRICPEGSQQSSKVYKAGSLQSLKRGQTTIKGEQWGLLSLPGGLVALMSQRGLGCQSPAWLLGMGRGPTLHGSLLGKQSPSPSRKEATSWVPFGCWGLCRGLALGLWVL